MTIHQLKKRDWPRKSWIYPRIHNFEFGFGLDADDAAATKNSTIATYLFQDNALIDLETVKTNPENADFAVAAEGNIYAGSYVPRITVHWVAYLRPTDTEIVHLLFNTMPIYTSFLNRLDAFDKKTGETVATILELTSETTDEQCYPLFNNTKLYEGAGTYDMPANHPGLSGTQQPEGVAFDKEMFFDAMHYYTNKQMLKQVAGRMRSHTLSEPIVPHGKSIITGGTNFIPSIAKAGNPYTFCGELFSVPQAGSRSQYHLGAGVTAVEHLTVKGFVRFNEFNPDFNTARA